MKALPLGGAFFVESNLSLLKGEATKKSTLFALAKKCFHPLHVPKLGSGILAGSQGKQKFFHFFIHEMYFSVGFSIAEQKEDHK